jgi:hypothetical protein
MIRPGKLASSREIQVYFVHIRIALDSRQGCSVMDIRNARTIVLNREAHKEKHGELLDYFHSTYEEG